MSSGEGIILSIPPLAKPNHVNALFNTVFFLGSNIAVTLFELPFLCKSPNLSL